MAPVKEAVYTDKAPLALNGKVFNQAIKANGFVFCSGQIAQDPSGKVIEGDVKAHTVSTPTFDVAQCADAFCSIKSSRT